MRIDPKQTFFVRITNHRASTGDEEDLRIGFRTNKQVGTNTHHIMSCRAEQPQASRMATERRQRHEPQ
jgi:hypothetical protein